MFKKIALAAVSLMLAFSFTACGAEEKSEPSSPVTVTETATPETPEVTPEASMDEEFAQLIRENATHFASDPTEDIIYLAEMICESFDAGLTFEETGAVMVDAGAPAFDSGFVIGASVSYLCPEYEEYVSKA